MTTDHDTTGIVRAWLRSDDPVSAERVLDNVLNALDITPQRRVRWPNLKLGELGAAARIAVATALVAVLIVGFSVLPGLTGPGPGLQSTPSPTPSPTVTPSLTPLPAPSAAAVFPEQGALQPGRHAFSEDGIGFSLDVPAGWSSSGLDCGLCAPNSGWIQKPQEGGASGANDVSMRIWGVDGVAAEACGHVPAPVADPGISDLAMDVRNLVNASGPADITLGGKPAKYLIVDIRGDIACDATQYYLWYDDVPCGGEDPCFRSVTTPNSRIRIWLVDVDGRRLWLEAETYASATAELEQEIQDIIASIQFE